MSLFEELRQLEDQGIDLIEILGQDAFLNSPADLQAILAKLWKSGENLYVELLYFLTHRRFSPAQAEAIWQAILKHKRKMEEQLGRKMRFRVAALDYLYAKASLLKGVRVIGRPELEVLLSFVNIDEVTTVYNRRYFNQMLAAEVQRARRYGSPLSLLILDLDNFKQINDRLGHLEGDSALRQVARLLKENTRQPPDAVCRFGGDEFAVILPETSNSEAYSLAERIRRAVGRLVLHPRMKDEAAHRPGLEAQQDRPDEEAALAVSIGGATFPSDCEEAEELVRIADRLCLAAKLEGKNRIRMTGEKKGARSEA